MARNAVMLAHMETLPPDLVSLRRMAIPDSWSNEKQEKEMQVPGWLAEHDLSNAWKKILQNVLKMVHIAGIYSCRDHC